MLEALAGRVLSEENDYSGYKVQEESEEHIAENINEEQEIENSVFGKAQGIAEREQMRDAHQQQTDQYERQRAPASHQDAEEQEDLHNDQINQ